VSSDKVRVAVDPRKGRCVVARAPIAAGDLIEAAPTIILTAAECAAIDRTILNHYYFHWDGEDEGVWRGAIALGITGLCNHAVPPRARVVRNFADETLDLIAVAPIAEGEEVTIDYNCPLWFEVSE
jgi:hypothetical protein